MNQTDDLYADVEKKRVFFAFFCLKTCVFGLFVVSLQKIFNKYFRLYLKFSMNICNSI